MSVRVVKMRIELPSTAETRRDGRVLPRFLPRVVEVELRYQRDHQRDVAQTWRTANNLGGGLPSSSARAAPTYATVPTITRPISIPLSKAHTKLMTAHWTASKHALDVC